MQATLLFCAALVLCASCAHAQTALNKLTYTGMVAETERCKTDYDALINKHWANDEPCRNLIFQAANSTVGTADKCTDEELTQIKANGGTLACCPATDYDSEFQACFSKNHDPAVIADWKTFLASPCELFYIINRADSQGESEGAISARDNSCLPRFDSMKRFVDYFLVSSKATDGAASVVSVGVATTVAATALVVMLLL